MRIVVQLTNFARIIYSVHFGNLDMSAVGTCFYYPNVLHDYNASVDNSNFLDIICVFLGLVWNVGLDHFAGFKLSANLYCSFVTLN